MRKIHNMFKSSAIIIFLFLLMMLISSCSYINNSYFLNKPEFSYQILIKPANTYESRELLLFSANETEWREKDRELIINGKEITALSEDELSKVFMSYIKYGNQTISIMFYQEISYRIYKNGELINYIPSLK